MYDAVVTLIEKTKYAIRQNLLGGNSEFVLQEFSEHQPVETLHKTKQREEKIKKHLKHYAWQITCVGIVIKTTELIAATEDVDSAP